MLESLLQVAVVAETIRNQLVAAVKAPAHPCQIIPRVHDPFPVAFGQPGHGPSGLRPATYPEHGPVPRPAVLTDVAAIVQGIAGNIGQGITDIPVAVQQDSLHVRSAQDGAFSVLPSQPHGIHPFYFLPIRFCILLAFRQHRDMAVIGDDGINDDDHVLSAGGDAQDLDHGIVIGLVTAEDGGLQPLHADMERMNLPDGAIRQFMVDNALHG